MNLTVHGELKTVLFPAEKIKRISDGTDWSCTNEWFGFARRLGLPKTYQISLRGKDGTIFYTIVREGQIVSSKENGSQKPCASIGRIH